MSSSLKPGWLTIIRETEDDREAKANCPYRETNVPVGTCFACSDYAGLAIDGPGRHSFVVCSRAEHDRIATTEDGIVSCPPDDAEP
jgi:hypothetical protein